MATIAFVPFHWAGNMNASFGLARKLQQRGHRVHYLCLPDTEERIRQQGFEFSPIFEKVYPLGTIPRQNAEQAAGKLFTPKDIRDEFRGVRDALVAGELERAVERLRPDAFVVSSGLPWVALAAHRTGLPVVCYSSNLISPFDPEVPPLTSELMPGSTSLYRLRVGLAWRMGFAIQSLFKLYWNQNREIAELAETCGYPVSDIDFRAEHWPRLKFPELVFCPSDLDFPRRKPVPNAHFVEASVDLQRKDVPFPWERLKPDAPLLYTAVGSMAAVMHRSKARKLIDAFLEAMARRPQWQGVVAVGKPSDVSEFRAPDNVIVVEEAPQLELLKRASLMVTHGGMNSIKESVSFGVPMVVVPLFFDHPGYAARLVYHGLALQQSLQETTGETLGARMDAVMGDPEFSRRTKAMAERFAAVEQSGKSVEVVESVLPAALRRVG